MKKTTLSGRRGFTLIAAVFIVLVLVLLAVTISTFVSSDEVIAVKNFFSQRAFYIAGSGVDFYLKELDGDSDWSTPPSEKVRIFSDGVFVITTTDETKNRITFTSTSYLLVNFVSYRRAIRLTVQRTGGGMGLIAGEFAFYVGGAGVGGETNIGNNVDINGSILLDTDIDLGENSLISGDVYADGDITGDTSGITGSWESDYEMPEDIPTLETTYFDNQIAVAETYPSGNRSYDGVQNLSGAYFINGDVTFRSNAVINVTGTAMIVATGRVRVRNGVTLGDNLTVIADGLIIIENNVNIGRYNLWYSSVGFDVGNNAKIANVGVGEGTQFITPGDIDFGNNVSYAGFIYAGGTLSLGNGTEFYGLIIANYVADIGENSNLSISPFVMDWDSLQGITGGGAGPPKTEITDWDEAY